MFWNNSIPTKKDMHIDAIKGFPLPNKKGFPLPILFFDYSK
jgi:hypothetical protein